MTGNLQADGVQSRRTLFVRYCPNFIYAFTQGQEKLRLDSNAQLKYRNSWACTALFSSENYLVNAERDNLGIIARVITLDGLTYTVGGTHSEQIKAFTGKNYGYIGSLLAEHLLASVRVLLDEGYLLTPEKNRIKAKISIDGVVSYGYRFCYPKIDEAFGPVNDAVYTYKRQSLGPMQIMEEREAAYGRDYQITDQPKPIEGKLFLL